jgi:o-succinylbenzoate synthase
MNRIESIDAHRLEVPLTMPYRLSFGAVHRYDTIIVETRDSEGRTGFGEATLLTGYTDETIADSWSLTTRLIEELCGRAIDAAQTVLEDRVACAPFVVTAFQTALEMTSGHRWLDVAETMRVPLLGLLQGDDEPMLREAFESLLDEGHRTVKIKVGFDVAHDVAFVQSVQRVAAGRARIRVDANQGYDARQAAAFVRSIDPAGIELFEQPCAAGDWVAHRAVVEAAARTGLALMLDESIYGIADIERAAREGACRYLKVKLMKFGGLTALAAAIERIRALDLVPVLGNGVACDVSCWMEACIAARLIDNAGEMNGFRKASPMLLDPPLAFEDGHVVLQPGIVPRLEMPALDRYLRDRVRRRAGSAA